jgi:MOSC domain-containing protein YiiM
MHFPLSELEAGLDEVRSSPNAEGRLELIVCRPAEDEREVLAEARLDFEEGLVGDSWRARGGAHPDMQLTLMNARAAALVAGERGRWSLAGDQLYVDLALGYENLPPGTRVGVGEAVVEISAEPHRGCGKFARRFGLDALKFVNSAIGRELNLRGVNARVVTGGVIRPGDPVRKSG